MATIALVALLGQACGSDGATNPDANKDRLEITFGYANGPNISLASMDLFQITKDGRLATPFISTSSLEMFPEWSNDGQRLVFTSFAPGMGAAASIWVANADLTGVRQLVVDPNPPYPSVNNQLFGSWSPDGVSLAFHRTIAIGGERGIAVIGADGSGLRWLAPGGDAPSWSVNGRIAFGKGGAIWTVNPDGSGLTSVTPATSDELPKWSRDGSRLVFLHATPSVGTNHDLDFDVVTTRADGSDRRTLVTRALNVSASWSPDGAYVLYEREDVTDPSQPKCALYKIPSAGGASTNLTPERGVGYCGGASWRPM